MGYSRQKVGKKRLMQNPNEGVCVRDGPLQCVKCKFRYSIAVFKSDDVVHHTLDWCTTSGRRPLKSCAFLTRDEGEVRSGVSIW